MVKYHFITFATSEYMECAKQNAKSALEIGGFDTATIYTPNHIDDNFKNKNIEIIRYKRGGGYWLWKPYFILKKLLELNDDDILCYNDSKYLWLKNVRLLENNKFNDTNIVVFFNKPKGNVHIEKNWTKLDALAIMNITPGPFRDTVKNTFQSWAGLVLLKKNFFTIRFIGEWLTYCQDPRIITDNPSIFGPEDKSFTENRHDQTVLSLLLKKWGILTYKLENGYLLDLRNP